MSRVHSGSGEGELMLSGTGSMSASVNSLVNGRKRPQAADAP
jgi:hypothetical protein